MVRIPQEPGEDRPSALRRYCMETGATLTSLAGESITFVPTAGTPRQELPADPRGWRSNRAPLGVGYRRRSQSDPWADDGPLLPDLGEVI
jgi:hypothetical protein